jgi:periplasmic protein TonB
MFEQAMLSSANPSRRAWTTGMGFAGEALLVGFIALIPILWPEAMPKPQALLMLLTPPAPPPPHSTAVVKPRAAHTPFERPLFTMPTSIPNVVTRVVDDPPDVVGGIPSPGPPTSDHTSLIDGIIKSVGSAPAPPVAVTRVAPQLAAQPAEPRRIRTSSIEMARLIHRVEPVYPQVARMVHAQGTVELTGIIAIDGHIRELKALSGNPLLIKAALDAVSQWIYAPPVLNGERVEVIAPITVNFRLDNR